MIRYLAKPGRETGSWILVPVERAWARPVFGPIAEGGFPCKGNTLVSIPSPRLYILREEFPRMKRDVLMLRIRERIRSLGIWPDGMDITFAIKTTRTAKSRDIYTILTLPDPHVSILETENCIQLAGVFPHQAAIAGLVARLTREPVLIANFSTETLELIVAQEGIPIHCLHVPLDTDGSLAEPMIFQTFEMARQTVQRNLGIDVRHTLALGSGRAVCPRVVGGLEIWNPDWRDILDVPDPLAVFEHPDIFGLLFADKAFDLLPTSWHVARHLENASRWTARIALPVGIAIFAAALYISHSTAPLKEAYGHRLNEITARQTRIQSMLPGEDTLVRLQSLAEIVKKARKEPNPEQILQDIASDLPANVRIRNMEITRKTPENGTLAASTPESLLDNPLSIRMELVTKGMFTETKDRFDTTVRGIEKMFDVDLLTWTYSEEDAAGTLSVMLRPRPSWSQS